MDISYYTMKRIRTFGYRKNITFLLHDIKFIPLGESLFTMYTTIFYNFFKQKKVTCNSYDTRQ